MYTNIFIIDIARLPQKSSHPCMYVQLIIISHYSYFLFSFISDNDNLYNKCWHIFFCYNMKDFRLQISQINFLISFTHTYWTFSHCCVSFISKKISHNNNKTINTHSSVLTIPLSMSSSRDYCCALKHSHKPDEKSFDEP